MNESSHPIPEGGIVREIAFAAIVLAMLPAVLDQTILATALPTIAHDLGQLTDVSWVITAYVVTAAASTPLWGKLGDRHGRGRLLELALASFLAASAVCGAAQSMTWLIVARAVQGVAAGGLMTLAMAAVGDLVSPRERGRYQGYIAATFAIATVRPAPRRPAGAARELAVGLLRQPSARRRGAGRPAAQAPRDGVRSAQAPAPTSAGAALLDGATIALMLACIWGGYAIRVGLGDDRRADRRGRRARGRARRARATRGRSDRATGTARTRPCGCRARRCS